MAVDTTLGLMKLLLQE